MPNIHKSISLNPKVYEHLEKVANAYFQDNISMCLNYILIKYFEEQGVEFTPKTPKTMKTLKKEESITTSSRLDFLKDC